MLPEISSTLGELEEAFDECGLPLKYCACDKFSFLEGEIEEDFDFNFLRLVLPTRFKRAFLTLDQVKNN